MKIPDKAYEAFYDRGTIFYLPRKTKYKQEMNKLELPKWLKQLITDEIAQGYTSGFKAAQKNMRTNLGI